MGTQKKKLKVFTAFSGYDSQCMALDRLKEDYPEFDYELVGWSEIDKPAIESHNAVFPQYADKNYGDISKIDWKQVEDIDLFTYSSPCTDFSICGKQLGGEEGSGTRSSLLWECKRCIEEKRPKYLILENVKALVSEKFKPLFLRWKKTVDDYGYDSYWEVLNSRDYDVPQNRERVFMVSIRRDDPDKMERYYFPAPMDQKRQIVDFLEKNVPEEYYLPEKKIPLFYDLLNNAGVDYEEVSEYVEKYKKAAPKTKEKPECCECESEDSSLISCIKEENRKKEQDNEKEVIQGGYRPDFNKLF